MEPDRSILWEIRISASTASSCTRRVRQLFEAKASGILQEAGDPSRVVADGNPAS